MNKEKIDSLLVKYSRLIEASAARYSAMSKRNDDYDDIKQVASLAFIKACETYREDRGVTLGLYAKICIGNACISYLRKQNKKTAPVIHPSPSADTEQKRDMLAEGLILLSPLEKKVLLLRLDGQDLITIGKNLGISRKSVDNALSRAKKKLKGFLGIQN